MNQKKLDTVITAGALALGAGSVAAHHVGAHGVDDTIVKAMTSDLARGVAFGAGGGAAVAVVSRASMAEIMGRMFVGGIMAAVASPWLAETILYIPTSSTSYPVLCTSIGVLGYQIVIKLAHDPSVIPIIGPMLAKFLPTPEAENLPSQASPERAATNPAPAPSLRSFTPPEPLAAPSNRVRVPLA